MDRDKFIISKNRDPTNASCMKPVAVPWIVGITITTAIQTSMLILGTGALCTGNTKYVTVALSKVFSVGRIISKVRIELRGTRTT